MDSDEDGELHVRDERVEGNKEHCTSPFAQHPDTCLS